MKIKKKLQFGFTEPQIEHKFRNFHLKFYTFLWNFNLKFLKKIFRNKILIS